MVTNIQRFSVEDGPGVRTTVFLKGCPLACDWCHNPETINSDKEIVFRHNRCLRCGDCGEACPLDAIGFDEGGYPVLVGECNLCGDCVKACSPQAIEIIGRLMTVEELMAELRRDIAFYEDSGGGVTFSGGEPLMQAEFLGAVLKACRAEEISTAVDTCGAVAWQTFEGIMPDVDLFLYDIKLIDDERHRKVTGVSNIRILENLRRLAESGARILVRMPIVPGKNAADEDIAAAGGFIASLPGIDEVEILPYHETGGDKYKLLNRKYMMPPTERPSAEDLSHIASILESSGLKVVGRRDIR